MQSGFCTTYPFKIHVSERKCKNNLKNCESQKEYFTILIDIYNVYVMFYYEIPWFYQDFKNENLCFLNLHENTGPVTRDIKFSQMRSKTPLQL